MGFDTLTLMDREVAPIIRSEVDFNFTNYKKWWFGGIRPRKFQKWLQEKQHIEHRVWRKAIRECDIFVFKWSTFKSDYSDIEELKRLGKKIVYIFCGDDVRWYYAAKQEYEKYGLRSIEYDSDYNYESDALELKLRRLRIAERYADFIFSRTDQAQMQLRPYYRYHMWVDPKRINNNPQQRKLRPIVAHAPSNRALKGTSFVLNVFDRLKNEGVAFEPLLLENVPNEKATQIYSDVDILIDQLIITGTGKLASEALAAGCVVMSHMAYNNYPQKNPLACPILDVNPDNLYENLKQIILNHEERSEIASRGLAYVEQNLDIRLFCKKIISLVNGEKIAFDYEPTFFRESFVPESDDKLALYNSWNTFVRNEEWYSKNIKPGTRAGLLF